MNRNLMGSTYRRFCIKFPQSRMKGERHRLSPLSLQYFIPIITIVVSERQGLFVIRVRLWCAPVFQWGTYCSSLVLCVVGVFGFWFFFVFVPYLVYPMFLVFLDCPFLILSRFPLVFIAYTKAFFLTLRLYTKIIVKNDALCMAPVPTIR